MSPPLPPLPPSGPPSGLNFSRCTEAHPLPPSPAAACSTTRSTKVVIGAVPLCASSWTVVQTPEGGPGSPGPPSVEAGEPWLVLLRACRNGLGDRDRDDVHDPT